MKEEWKQIDGFCGQYEISNTGKVKSIGRYKDNHGKKQWIPEKIMLPNIVGAGYLQVRLSKNAKSKNYYIHRLVAEHFVYNENNYKEVNHIDENKKNNIFSNLEWCTRRYNNMYGTRIEMVKKHTDYKKINENRDFRAMAQIAASRRRRAVKQIDINGRETIYRSATDAAKINGFNQSDICLCCGGKLKTAKGYRWEYVY